jgi:hypothetical protein
MNGQEVGRLLGLIALGDNRKPPGTKQEQDAMIAWWLDKVGDLDYADAARAVGDHQRESTEYLTAAHIRQRVQAMRNDRLRHTTISSLKPPEDLPDDPEAYLEWQRGEMARIAAAPRQPQALEAGQ